MLECSWFFKNFPDMNSFSRRKNDIDCASKFWCAVPECTADGRKKSNLEKYPWMEGVQFFPFPTIKRDKRLRSRWLSLINRENFDPKRHHRICSRHFEDGKPTEANPLPTLFPRNNFKRPLKERSQNLFDKRSRLACQKNKSQEEPLSSFIPCEDSLAIVDANLQTTVIRPVVSEVLISTITVAEKESEHSFGKDFSSCQTESTIQREHNYRYVEKDIPEFDEKATQTDLTGIDIDRILENNRILNEKLENKQGLMLDGFMDNVLKSDKSVKMYTGVENKDLLDGLFKTLDNHESSLKYWSGEKSTKDMNYQMHGGKPGPKRKLTRYQEFLLTLIRLRLGLVGFLLADIFGVSNSRISQIFTTWITFMALVFGRFIKWQSKEMNQKHMPKSFKKKFPRTRSIIDCTELFVQRPRTPSAQSSLYSSYKHHTTFKSLVSITPTGAFNYVSDLWGGNVSDRYLTENSGYLDNIEPNDDIMADRGFVIRDLLTERRATLNIPPFTHKCNWGKRKRLNVNEIKKTREIANLRIHVERAIQRLKCFRLLANIIPLKLKPVCNQMMKVAAFICNLSKPLVTK